MATFSDESLRVGYVYRHVRLDTNEVFYIGIGSDEPKYTRSRIERARNIFWKRIVQKTKYRVDIMFENDCYDTIKEKEREFIILYGRRDLGLGTLCNLTDGGDGTIGRPMNEYTKSVLLKYNKNRPTSKKQKQVVGERYKGKSGMMHNRSKPVYCKEDDTYFGSISELSRCLNIPTATIYYYINIAKKYKDKSYTYCDKSDVVVDKLYVLQEQNI